MNYNSRITQEMGTRIFVSWCAIAVRAFQISHSRNSEIQSSVARYCAICAFSDLTRPQGPRPFLSFNFTKNFHTTHQMAVKLPLLEVIKFVEGSFICL